MSDALKIPDEACDAAALIVSGMAPPDSSTEDLNHLGEMMAATVAAAAPFVVAAELERLAQVLTCRFCYDTLIRRAAELRGTP